MLHIEGGGGWIAIGKENYKVILWYEIDKNI